MPLAEMRGGCELCLSQLMQQRTASNVDWSVVFLQDGPMVQQFKAWGIDTHIIDAGRVRWLHRCAATIYRLSRLIRSLHVDVVLSWAGKAHLYGGLAAATTETPAMWFQHGIPDRSVQNRLATMVPAMRVLACSQFAASRQADIWPARQTRVVYPAVDLTRNDPKMLSAPSLQRKALGLPATGAIVGMVGRLQRWKGFHYFVDAMATILARHPDTTFVIVGGVHQLEASYGDELRARIALSGLAEKVVVAGFQSNVPEWMQAMDVVVHASENEPFGMVIIEAMALGKVVVAADQGGALEIITEGADGHLWSHGDVSSLATTVSAILDDPVHQLQIGQRARRRAEEFSLQRFAMQVVSEVTAVASAYSRHRV